MAALPLHPRAFPGTYFSLGQPENSGQLKKTTALP